MKNIHGRRRIDALNSEGVILVVDLANENTFVAILRQMFCDIVYRVHHPNIEMVGPVALRIGWRRMPVIFFLIIDQDGQLARRMDQIAIWRRRQRQPADEMRIGLERVVVVIQKYQPGRARKYDRVTRSRFFQRMVMALSYRLDMRRV